MKYEVIKKEESFIELGSIKLGKFFIAKPGQKYSPYGFDKAYGLTCGTGSVNGTIRVVWLDGGFDDLDRSIAVRMVAGEITLED